MNRRSFLFSLPLLGLLPKVLASLPAAAELVASPLLDELNATTLKTIYPVMIRDEVFRPSPFLAYVRMQAKKDIGGGAFIESTFLHDGKSGVEP